MRDKIKRHAQGQGIRICGIWLGTEFEEFLWQRAESLLQRFIEGETLPDAAAEMLVFAHAVVVLSDTDAVALLACLFDRPAFYTPIRRHRPAELR